MLLPDSLFISISPSEQGRVSKLNSIFRQAVVERVADVHFHQTDRFCRVRFRMPGAALVNFCELTKGEMELFDDKIRARAKIPMNDRVKPYDGRISMTMDGVDVDIRVSITPGVNGGQLIVCRILNQANSKMKLADIRMTSLVRESFISLINEPNGLFLVTGPTGSGKTTTLYALLNEVNDESRNIITVENPVEYRNTDFHQIDVDGVMVTFADALRSVLRQDPDVIMVGEIRDAETANIAIQASLTGHLVIATLHANNAPGAIVRMLEFGVDHTSFATALRGVTAQRLIRTLANPGRHSVAPPGDIALNWLKANNIHRKNAQYPKASGSGDYKGFVPVMEVVLADHRVKKAFDGGIDAIYEAASRQAQFETLAQAAERLAFSGYTTIEMACLVSSIQEAPSIKNRRLGQVLVDMGAVSSDAMQSLLDWQACQRIEGAHHHLGKLLVDGGLCTENDVRRAIGYTAEAQDILQKICVTEERRIALRVLMEKSMPGKDSLFQMAVESGLVTFEELINANPV